MQTLQEFKPFTIIYSDANVYKNRSFDFSTIQEALTHLRTYRASFPVSLIEVEVKGGDESLTEFCTSRHMAMAKLMEFYQYFWDIIQEQVDHATADADYEDNETDTWDYNDD